MGDFHRKTAVFPATLWQEYVLDEAVHPDCRDDLRDRMILAHAFWVRPHVDVRRLERAVEKLRRRHDTLRIRFERKQQAWRAQIEPPGQNIVRVMDLGDLDKVALHAEVSRIAHAPMPLIDSPLMEVIVIKCGTVCDVLVIRIHHALTDGFGMLVLVEDLLKLLIGLPLVRPAVSHAEYILKYQSPLPGDAERNLAFWEALHADFPNAPNVGRKAKGVAPLFEAVGEVVQRQLACQVTPESLQGLEERAAGLNISAATLLFSGYLEGLCQRYDLNRVVFLTSISRANPALDSYVGNHTFNPVIPYASRGAGGLASAAQALGKTMVEAMAHLPSEAARPNVPYRTALVDGGGHPIQFYLHQPLPRARRDRSMFRPGLYADHGEKQQLGPYTITSIDVSKRHRTFSEMVFDIGADEVRTGFTFNYDGMGYSEEEMRGLAREVAALLDVEMTDMVAS